MTPNEIPQPVLAKLFALQHHPASRNSQRSSGSYSRPLYRTRSCATRSRPTSSVSLLPPRPS
jgi:hypothetical protein